MKKLLFITLSLLFLLSCNDDKYVEEQSGVESKLRNQRMQFSNSKELEETLVSLDAMSLLDLKGWSNDHMTDSYFSSREIIDSTVTYIPNKLKAILNSDLEYQINDTIVWYNNFKLYILSDNSNVTKEERERLKREKENLVLISDFSPTPINEADELKTRTIIVKDNKTNNIYDLGSVTYKPTIEGRKLLTKSNPGMKGETITVKAELYSYTEPYRDYLETRATYRVMKWYSLLLKVRLFDRVNGVEVEIKDPVLNMEFSGLMTYSYVHNFEVFYPDWKRFNHQGFITNKKITLDNTIEVFSHEIAKNRDVVEEIVVMILDSKLNFQLGNHPELPGTEMFIIKDINL